MPSSSSLIHSHTLELQRPSSRLSSQTTPSMSGAGGKWMVSSVTEENIMKLWEAGYLAADIAHRLPDAGQIIPTTEPHERVVFLTHFVRGLGFPLHPFVRGLISTMGWIFMIWPPISSSTSRHLSSCARPSSAPDPTTAMAENLQC